MHFILINYAAEMNVLGFMFINRSPDEAYKVLLTTRFRLDFTRT